MINEFNEFINIILVGIYNSKTRTITDNNKSPKWSYNIKGKSLGNDGIYIVQGIFETNSNILPVLYKSLTVSEYSRAITEYSKKKLENCTIEITATVLSHFYLSEHPVYTLLYKDKMIIVRGSKNLTKLTDGSEYNIYLSPIKSNITNYKIGSINQYSTLKRNIGYIILHEKEGSVNASK